MLLEICCRCGFVHKDSRREPVYRAYKPHYHWTPAEGERIVNGVTLHATICVGCCGLMIDWEEFAQQKLLTPAKYRVKGSLNAPLPDYLMKHVDPLYADFAKHFPMDED